MITLPPSPEQSQQTLSSWLKNMNKLDSLINRLQELASSAPPENRAQLLNKVAALRATFKKQQERFIEFLKLSEEYADNYLHNISTQIEQQSTVLDNLRQRLDAANKIQEEAVDLQTFNESGTVAAMKDLRLPRPFPEDDALFSEVDSVVAKIRRFYEELNKFWTEEIRHVVEALKKGRTDPKDLERWNKFHSSLKQTLGSWKNRPPNGDAETLRSYNTSSSSTGADLGAITSSLSPTIGSLEGALERMSSSSSLKHSQLGRPLFQRVYVAFAANSGLCLSFLQHCTDYGENVPAWCQFSITLLASPVGAPSDLRERTTGLRSEVTDVSESTEDAASAQGPRTFKIAYNKALTLEQKTASGLIQGLNTLIENISSWAAITDGPTDDALPGVVTLEQLDEAKWAWEKSRDSVRVALKSLTSEPAQRVASIQRRSGFKLWMRSLVCFS
ncbi:hypothetical protein BJV77DRAFT_1162758 [Russula vinacea]|nr:hypothetical protein BJV77DRAFT_1162758 [Russula vinacea]